MDERRTADIFYPTFRQSNTVQRKYLADTLQVFVDQIRSGQLEYDPHGFVLVLMSKLNPAECEVLHAGVAGTAELDRCANAIHWHAELARQIAREAAALALLQADKTAPPHS